MRSFITAILVAVALALVFALVLNLIQQTTEMAFMTDGVRLNTTLIPGGKVNNEMTDLGNGGFVILGAIIAAIAGYVGAIRAAKVQVTALKDQSEEERRRLQQMRHQKKYEMALALRKEAERLGRAAEKRIPLAQASPSDAKHPLREQMTISVFSLFRGERGDIGLLSDELQDKALDLVSEVDDYNSHIETLPRPTAATAASIITVDQAVKEKLEDLQHKADSVAQKFKDFITKVRQWRCKSCGAFIDEILDVSADGQRKPCPVCNDMPRIGGLQATLGGQSNVIPAADVARSGGSTSA